MAFHVLCIKSQQSQQSGNHATPCSSDGPETRDLPTFRLRTNPQDDRLHLIQRAPTTSTRNQHGPKITRKETRMEAYA